MTYPVPILLIEPLQFPTLLQLSSQIAVVHAQAAVVLAAVLAFAEGAFAGVQVVEVASVKPLPAVEATLDFAAAQPLPEAVVMLEAAAVQVMLSVICLHRSLPSLKDPWTQYFLATLVFRTLQLRVKARLLL